MKTINKIFFPVLVSLVLLVPVSRAMTVYDPLNMALNQIRNVLLETQWVKEMALAAERLNELKTQTQEIFRFHSGFDEILHSVIGDSLGDRFGGSKSGLQNAFMDVGIITPQIEILEGVQGPHEIRRVLEEITGEIPQGNLRPHIPFEEMMVVDAFDFASTIREGGNTTRHFAEQLAGQAQGASPKGAARLQAQGISQLLILEQQSHEAAAKMIELQATQIEQVTRLEKQAERERLRYLRDANHFIEDHFLSLS